MPDIRSVVKKMIEDGESEDVISAVVKKLKGSDGSDIKSGLPDMSPELITPDKDEYRGPDSFWGGVLNSMKPGGDVDQAAGRSLKGFAKGTAAIPDTIADTAQGLASGVHSLIQDPKAHFRAISPAFKEMGQGMWDVTKNAGADPEAFGHLSGQMFGQPAFTEGLIKAPAIAKATTGAINRIPAVNKTFSSIGGKLEGTRQSNYVPSTSRGLVAGAVRGIARPVGRALSRVGERGRLDAGTRPPSLRTNIKLKGETETPHSPDSDIFAGGGEGAVRPRPIRHDTPDMSRNSEFTRPITETAEELAARNRPSAFTGGQSRRNQSRPFEPRPSDTTPYPRPGEPPPGIPGEAPLVRDTTPYEPPPTRPPGIPPERPITPTPDPIGVGEGGLSSRYRSRPYEPGQEAAALEGARPKPKTPPPAEPSFSPTTDPATSFTPEDIALMRAKRGELRTALEKMAGGESVDPLTGEITKTPRTKGPWRQSEPDVDTGDFEFGPDEPGVDVDPSGPDVINDAGRPFNIDRLRGSRFHKKRLNDEMSFLAEEASRRELTPGEKATFRKIENELYPGENWFSDEVNPFGTELPESVEQFSHRRPKPVPNEEAGFSGNKLPPEWSNDAGRQFANEVENTRYPGDEAYDLGEISPGFRPTQDMPDWGPPSARTIQPEEWGDWGPDAPDIPTLVPDASGSHVAAPLDPPDLTSPINQLSNDQLTRITKASPAEGMTGDRASAAQVELMRRGVGKGAPHVNDPTFYDANHGDMIDYNFREGTRRSTRLEPGETRPVNPLRPEVPPGQVTNRSMFQLSEQRGMENRIANQNTAGRRFAEEVSPAGAEFSEDMLLTPGEQMQSDIPPMRSPVENQYDPRISNMDQSLPNEGSVEFSGRRTIDTADDAGRDVRWDTETESYFDRNSRNWDDVTDATPEEIARAKGINTGETLDPTGPTPRYGTNLDVTALDRTEVNKRGQGQSRLNSMFGEDTAQRLNSGESSIGPSKEGPARRELGKKQLDKSEQATWNSWGDDYLDGIPPDSNKPGLHIYDSGEPDGPFKIVYRDAQGNPIGTLETGEFNTKGIKTLAVSTKIGLGRGSIAFKMLKEAIDRGITEATGPTSGMTKNLIERVQRVIKDSRNRGISNDEGMFGNSELELEINKILDGMDSPEFSSTPDESMGFAGSEDIFSTANDEGGKLVPKGGREKNFPSIIPDGFGKVGGRQVGPKGASYTIRDPNGKKLGDINVTPKDIAEVKAIEEYAHADDGEIAEMIYQDRKEDLLIKHGYDLHEPKVTSEPKTTRTKDVQTTPPRASDRWQAIVNELDAKKAPDSEYRDILSTGSKESLKRGETWRGRVLKYIGIDKKTGEIPAAEVELPEGSGMYKVQTEEGVEFPNDTLAVRPPANAGLDLRRGGTPSEMIPEDLGESLDYSGTGREPRFPGDKPKGTNKSTAPKKDPINPDVDFGPGGDPRRIIGEFHRLSHDNAVDTRFRALLPKEMRGELGPGETYKGKMEILAREIMQELKQSPEEAANRLKEMDADRVEAQRRIDEPPLPDLTEDNLFNESVIAALAARDKAAVAKASAVNSPLPKLSKIDKSQLRPGKLDAQSKPWFSPRVQQQFNASWRRRTGQPPKPPKKVDKGFSGPKKITDTSSDMSSKSAVAKIGKIGSVMERETLDRLREEGWTYKPATLSQSWPAHKPANSMVRVVRLGPDMKGPYVFTPPK